MKGFMAGAAAMYSLSRSMLALAWSDTEIGRRARQNILSRLSGEQLEALRKQVEKEVDRRRLDYKEKNGT